MGIFKRAKKWDEGRYTRPRADAAPPGWYVVDAVVEHSERERTKVQVGGFNAQEQTRWVYRSTATYAYLDAAGGIGRITLEDRLRYTDIPQQGHRVLLAFDPADPASAVILEDENAHGARRTAYWRSIVESGIEAPVIVASARPTGRIARPEKRGPDRTISITRGGGPSAADLAAMQQAARQVTERAETILALWVYPPGGEPFQTTCTGWDDGSAVEGANGLLYYFAHEPEKGIPLFAADLAFVREQALAQLRGD